MPCDRSIDRSISRSTIHATTYIRVCNRALVPVAYVLALGTSRTPTIRTPQHKNADRYSTQHLHIKIKTMPAVCYGCRYIDNPPQKLCSRSPFRSLFSARSSSTKKYPRPSLLISVPRSRPYSYSLLLHVYVSPSF